MTREDRGNAAWDLARLRLAQADAERMAYLTQAISIGTGDHTPGRKPPGPAACVVCGSPISSNSRTGKCRPCWHRDYTRENRKPETEEQKEKRRIRQRRSYAKRRQMETAEERAAANAARRSTRPSRRKVMEVAA